MAAETAPTSERAKSATLHSSRVRPMIATTSPRRTPSDRNPFARSSIRASASAQDTGCHAPSLSTRYAGVGRSAATASRQRRPIVRAPCAGSAARGADATSATSEAYPRVGGKRRAAWNEIGPGRLSFAAMRTIWNGSISFGLVSIPVGLAPATKPKARQSDISFRTLHRECKTPIRQKRWCPFHEREVGPDEVVKGWEVAKGQFVIVEDSDLEAIERQSDSRSIEINQFVNLAEIDPIFFDRTYF